MTQITELQAGRELDTLMAKKVMKWRQLSYRLWHDERGRERWIDNREGAWSPSTDIAAAWEVVEKLKMTITPNLCHPVIPAKWCADVELKGRHDLWLAGAETAPLAICRAALRAVEQCE